jgi:acetolactate synthase-1/2/3 large subunit
MHMKKVSTLLVEHIKRYGVTHVFGIPGKPIVNLNLEIEQLGIKYILCRHECGAGFAASGYALMNKTLGVAIVTAGPGGMNMLTAAGQAKAMNLPVLFITGHPSMRETGKALGQDSTLFGSDLVKMFEPVTLFSARVERGEVFHLYLQHAIEKALRGRGPVHLNIPADVLEEEIELFEIDLPQRAMLISSEIDQIIPLLNSAKTPVLFLGKGVNWSDAYDEVKLLSDRWSIPIMTTPGGKGSIANHEPLFLGSFGLGGSDEAEYWLRCGVDLMIVIGSKLSDMSTAGLTPDLYPRQIVQFDYESTFIGKTIPVPTIGIIGDLKANLQNLLKQANEKNLSTARVIRAIPKKQKVVEVKNELLSASRTMRILRKNLPKDTIMFGDAGSNTFYAVKHFDILEPGTFYFDENFIAMGHGIGYSIGAKLARPDKRIVCITGDGCMLMHGAEISTAVCNNISISFIILNNGRLDMVDKGMKKMVGCSVGTIYETPLDATLFARSLGATAFCCHSESDIENCLQIALNHQGPIVVEIMVDPEEVPPILGRVL